MLTHILFLFFPASENIIANFTQSMSPTATDSKVSSQSKNISASASLTLSSALSLATRTSAVARTFSTYLSQDASLSLSESFSSLHGSVDSLSTSKQAMSHGAWHNFRKYRLLNRRKEAYIGKIIFQIKVISDNPCQTYKNTT